MAKRKKLAREGGKLKLPDDVLGTVKALLNTKPPNWRKAPKKKLIRRKADKK